MRTNFFAFLLLISVPAFAERQLGFLVPIDEEAPLDLKKFKNVECQYEVACYPVWSIKETQTKRIYEIRGTDDKPYLVRDGEIAVKYLALDDFLNTAMLDFIGHDVEIAANPDSKTPPLWMNYLEHPKPLGVAFSKEKKKMTEYNLYDKPNGSKIAKTEVSWSNVMNWTYAVCDKFDCKIPYYEVQGDYFKVLAPPPKMRAPTNLENFSKLPGDEPKYVWLKNSNLDGKGDVDPAIVDKVDADMFRPSFPQLKDIDVIAVKTIGTQIWLQVDFLRAGRCDGLDKKVIGRAWIPAFKSDDNLNVHWYARGC